MAFQDKRRKVTTRENVVVVKGTAPRVAPPKQSESRKPPGANPTKKY